MFFINLLFFFLLGAFADASEAPKVLVSIAPYEYFVKTIGGKTVEVVLLVPSGASFHYYEPTLKQVMEASQAEIWFRIGEPFESRVLAALKGNKEALKIVDLRDRVDLISEMGGGCSHCQHDAGADLHIWLSPRQVKIQAATIAKALSQAYPKYAEEYQTRLQALLQQLDLLDQRIAAQLAPLRQRTILTSHPAYAYFARDYGLTQLPIECEGKDPSPKQLHEILMRARQLAIKQVYVQPQYSTRGADLIGKALGAQVVSLNPYSEDYFAALNEIAMKISEQDKAP